MNLFSYIVASDLGLAPNPFSPCCSLACCKPAIRRIAKSGDLVVGLSPKAQGHRIVYIMRITGKMKLEDYWKHPKYHRKRPVFDSSDEKERKGDNFYQLLPNGQFKQMPSQHSNTDGTEKQKAKNRDLSGKYVLLSNDFVYFGSEAILLERRFRALIVGRGHKRFSVSETKLVKVFKEYFEELPRGRQAMPSLWDASSSCASLKARRKCSCG